MKRSAIGVPVGMLPLADPDLNFAIADVASAIEIAAEASLTNVSPFEEASALSFDSSAANSVGFERTELTNV